jgi:molecular chaperone IbpA
MASKVVERSRFIQPLRGMLNEDVREWFVGVDRMIDDLAARWEQAWEGFNHFPASSVERVDDRNYEIRVQVSGYEKKDLEVTVAPGDVLVISGRHEGSRADGSESSSFEQRFLLADTLHVDSAKFNDGVLTVNLSFPEATWAKDISVKIE